MDIKLSAEVYRIGVSIGLLTIEDIMKWADNVIEQYDTPRYEIIELSLSAKKKLEDITLSLMEISGDFDNNLPPKIILQKMDKVIQYLPDSFEGIEWKFIIYQMGIIKLRKIYMEI
ncbi:hypothetical protein [Psychrobacillus lasiicapitis]|uniref:Uncharacterized protein n=1 Tax=Psychrobacillus lasiicapitis TaxID=1636719 RepID=A0A544SSI5_9BACI|nr:hypothetical protein [Psychrobacillus lasiicapitis]TQR08137.1 hypothetical protein FG382_21745 [Psychrobacillus lasiicapitis]GGA49537.1 hypothetical protein GCM10011384_44010 [Psychrobacillus lasiicapitis]